MKRGFLSLSFALGLAVSNPLWAQSGPDRVGTTTASFLEMGVGSAGCAMGEAYVGLSRDLSDIVERALG